MERAVRPGGLTQLGPGERKLSDQGGRDIEGAYRFKVGRGAPDRSLGVTSSAGRGDKTRALDFQPELDFGIWRGLGEERTRISATFWKRTLCRTF